MSVVTDIGYYEMYGWLVTINVTFEFGGTLFWTHDMIHMICMLECCYQHVENRVGNHFNCHNQTA